ncbi:MAG TPA: hypothetical protein VFQ40_06630 [Actinomycetota bacterium]|nr:hypothetical protein [Actinomycetota bacterium]
MRRVLLASVAAVSSWGCSLAGAGPPTPDAGFQVTESPSPFNHVTSGEVEGVVLDDWIVSPIVTDLRRGFVAAPRPGGLPEVDGTTIGMSASWVDATRVGVPSDYYYLAANGPLLSRLTTSGNCRERSAQVYLDRRPTLRPDRWSPGHFMASGEGICRRGDRATLYAYFVAAPGYGPVHEMGIPTSGLYVVVAVVPQGRGAGHLLRALIQRTKFGDTGIREFVAAAGPRQ